MQSKVTPSEMPYSRAVHGLAITLTLAVFPLIWVGGLVTTYDAGMAVPGLAEHLWLQHVCIPSVNMVVWTV